MRIVLQRLSEKTGKICLSKKNIFIVQVSFHTYTVLETGTDFSNPNKQYLYHMFALVYHRLRSIKTSLWSIATKRAKFASGYDKKVCDKGPKGDYYL